MLPSKNLQKSNVRQHAKAVRKSLPMADISETILQSFQDLAVFHNATVVALYMPLPGEPDLTPLLTRYPEKTWLLPRLIQQPGETIASQLQFYRYIPGDPLEQHAYGMWEPTETAPLWQQAIDVMLLPGLAFDETGTRLGYGKGYYDRFLSTLEASAMPYLIGVVADALLLPELPADPWDHPMNLIVTEKRSLSLTKP